MFQAVGCSVVHTTHRLAFRRKILGRLWVVWRSVWETVGWDRLYTLILMKIQLASCTHHPATLQHDMFYARQGYRRLH